MVLYLWTKTYEKLVVRAMNETILEMKNIDKHFSGVHALKSVSL